ncbi:MAG: thioredoxin [bacterium]
MSEIIFTKENFEKELKSSTLVLIDFWAPWCGPCRVMGQIIKDLAIEMEGKNIKIGKINIDEYPEFAEKYGIMSIPAMVIFKSGKVVEKLVGIRTQEELKEKLEVYIEK